MKKVLFIGYNMEMGGAERALVNVLNLIKDKCEIDLILLEKKGVLMRDIPKSVNVLEVKTNIVKYALFRYIPFFRKKILNKLAAKKYDLAVAFMEGRAATLISDLKQECYKIAWIHNDVNLFDIGINEKEIKNSYNNVDLIVAVSEQSKDNFCKKYNIETEKVKVIYNLINEDEIIKKANAFVPSKEKFTFVNVAKMRPQKRHDRLLRAASELKKKGYNFKIWIVGNGPLEKKIKQLAIDLNVEDVVDFLGLQENPYPFIKNADYFVMTSDHEGYPLSLLESLLLKTKIITTDVSGAREMLENNKYGYIVGISTEEIVQKMAEVMDNNELSKKLDKNLKSYRGANEKIKKELLETFKIIDKGERK